MVRAPQGSGLTPDSHAGCCGHGLQPLSSRLSAAEALCSARGVKLTGPRRQVLEALNGAGRALGAYDLIDIVSRSAGKRVAPITVYRALDFLVGNDLVHRIESQNAFLACPAGHGPHPQAVFMICETCGKVCESASPGLEAALAALAGAKGFRHSSRIIELKGVCADCARATGA